jgi:hypothetical protein
VKGDSWFHAGVVETVNVFANVEASAKYPPDTEFNKIEVEVPVIAAMLVPAACVACKGTVGAVKFPVYTPTPLTTRTFVR